MYSSAGRVLFILKSFGQLLTLSLGNVLKFSANLILNVRIKRFLKKYQLTLIKKKKMSLDVSTFIYLFLQHNTYLLTQYLRYDAIRVLIQLITNLLSINEELIH